MIKTNSIFSDVFGGRRSAKISYLSLLSVLLVLFTAPENISAQTGGFIALCRIGERFQNDFSFNQAAM